jgi:hypothetical protein
VIRIYAMSKLRHKGIAKKRGRSKAEVGKKLDLLECQVRTQGCNRPLLVPGDADI